MAYGLPTRAARNMSSTCPLRAKRTCSAADSIAVAADERNTTPPPWVDSGAQSEKQVSARPTHGTCSSPRSGSSDLVQTLPLETAERP
jgi:hypothetical protein